ncbi:beta-ketoacyl-ACP synthase III [Desulfuromonas acetoxidans]|uniref:Beta-ketoacyl-[acyl-carrier-protein] synthase III n=1 Tax=Desulfuromonas acetoxidans (strain DSM 684 / 11070) TaxID=281689 RepID=Q1JZI9_DESA6|nr:beta-ketoacyl-ACP synthase III [Desulfuromonas acetoxidans]EAT15578.1 3-oxoacyl-(acyl-carrier-protein) synthase III [Desulfuromonas acetoxidans DSM 684]MBF0646094.1 ketoacyl-ACP synthase III [Desulfuromonas acetoxidans]NVD25170.1 ketoacyl-ACP synthase III [Desulfuromonas acetoxidans]NVE17208.1 ketoacyl-ACP synthase III [Desulfuromonas acetoxidans]
MNPHCRILATGHAVPSRVLTNADLESMVDTNDTWIVERTGIRQRHIAEPGSALSDLAADAANQALAKAKVKAEDIDLIIVGTVTADMKFPSLACLVQEKIGANNAAAFDLSAACSGFLYGLHLADSLIQTSGYQHVLVIAAEMLSSMVNWQDRNTCVLFGDGAGAAVIGAAQDDKGILSTYMKSDGRHHGLLYNPGGSQLPLSHELVDSNEATIHMEGREVFRHAVVSMTDALHEALKRAQIAPEALDLLIPHQANIRIIEGIGKRFKIDSEKVYVNVDRFGNTSAASIPIALNEALENGRIQPGDVVGLVTFGAGLTWSSSIIRF